MKRGVIIGRFQPFHLGHLNIVKNVIKECEEMVIVIGSSQFNYTMKNPFTAGERLWMVHESLKESKQDMNKIYVVPFVNDENNFRWIRTLKTITPPFDIIYSGNEFIKTLLNGEDILVKRPSFLNKTTYNGTNIRKLILQEKKEWRNLVTESVAKIILEIDGLKRIRAINKTINDAPSLDAG
ncbi:MAG: nicotinamide-nucleotide adenylyltransferase [Thermoproteota archaeon]|nr:nicotinamide-nucleotide adenylyltransferase [Thermoproteota archaeon]